MNFLGALVRRKVFISYHHADGEEVRSFVSAFDHATNSFEARGLGLEPGMADDIVRSVISLDVKHKEGNVILVPYDTVDSHGTPVKSLADRWWLDYSTATERMPYPYSFIVSNRPVQLPLDVVHPETSRVGLRSTGDHGYEFGEHQVMFVDLSGVSDDMEQCRLIKLARSFLNAEATKRFDGRANSALQPTSRSRKSLAKAKDRARVARGRVRNGRRGAARSRSPRK